MASAARWPRSRGGATSSSGWCSPTCRWTARAPRSRGSATTTRFGAVALDASDADAIVALAEAERADAILNACDPWLNPPIFAAAGRAGCTYLDMAMTLSERHPERPFEEPGVMLGDAQFAVADEWEAAGRLALCGIGVEPGLSDVFARYAADHLFSRIDEIGVRDGADLAVAGHAFAPDVLDLDHDRGVPQPAADLGARPRLVHDGAVLRAGGVRVPGGDRAGRVRQRRARGGRARSRAGSTASG